MGISARRRTARHRTTPRPIKFATEGDHFHNNTALDPMLVQIQGGQVKAIAPPDSAQAKMIYPLPPLG